MPQVFLRYRRWVIISLFLCLAGCVNQDFNKLRDNSTDWTNLHKHLLNVNESGGIDALHAPDQDIYSNSADLKTWSETLCRNDDALQRANPDDKLITRSIDRIMVEFSTYAKKQVSKGKQARVILILHGGLVSIEEGTVEAHHILEAMDIENSDFFPIFLNWEAGIPRSYFDHLLNVRRGERVGKLRGYSTAPFVGFADFGRALGSTPVFLYQQAGYAWSGQKTGGRFPERDGNRIPDGWVGNVELPSNADQPKQKLSLLTFFPGIVRLATTPLADFAGTGAYQNMLRRSRLMFLLDSDFKQIVLKSKPNIVYTLDKCCCLFFPYEDATILYDTVRQIQRFPPP